MLIIRIQTFLKSLFWHIYAGSPKSTNKQILERYNICISCEEYNSELTMCNQCGCNINNKKQFLNKLAWADQKCPLDKWGTIEVKK